jgi:hypothetical protein
LEVISGNSASLGWNNATFEDKTALLELLDVSCSALKMEREIVYIKCKQVEQQVLQLQTLP